MDYFGGLAERVFDSPPELRPRLVTEFEAEPIDDGDAWEEITDEVIAPKRASVEAGRRVSEEAVEETGESAASTETRKPVSIEVPAAELTSPSAPAPIRMEEQPEVRPLGQNEPERASAETATNTQIIEAPTPQVVQPIAPEPRILRIPAPKAERIELPSDENKGRGDEPSRTLISFSEPQEVQAPTEERRVAPPREKEPVTTIETVKVSDRVIHIPVSIDRTAGEGDEPEPQAPTPKPAPATPQPHTPTRPAAKPQALIITEVQSPTPQAETPTRREPEPEPNIVEIHIGRIEVRPPAAPPPRPTPKPRGGRLSLDDVLSRTRSGR